METAVGSVAREAELESTLLLHLGHRIVNGLDGIFISSTCSRDEHFGQTIIIIVIWNQIGYSIMLSMDPESETLESGSPGSRLRNSSEAVTPLSSRSRLF